MVSDVHMERGGGCAPAKRKQKSPPTFEACLAKVDPLEAMGGAMGGLAMGAAGAAVETATALETARARPAAATVPYRHIGSNWRHKWLKRCSSG